MDKSINALMREQRKNKRRAIQNRINELVAWLCENNASDAAWDANVRELNANELKLEMMDQPVSNTNCVEYGASLLFSVEMQY